MLKTILALALLASSVAAQTVEQDGAIDSYSLATARAEKIFIADQGAIEAEKECKAQTFSPGTLLTLNHKIAAEMAAASPTIAVGAARLINLRRQAEDDMDAKISHEGCSGPAATAALGLFNRKLAG